MSDWDEHAEAWDADPGPRAYADAAHLSLRGVLEARGSTLAGARVCDFGCGTGLMTERLADLVASIDAVDTSPAMLEQLASKVRDRGWQHVHPSGDLPSGSATYDLVVCSSVCSFLDDYPGTVQQLVDRLAPGGVLVQWDWERDEADPVGHGLTRAEIRDALGAAGLVAVEVETAFEVAVDDQVMRPVVGSGQRPVAS